MRLIDADRLSEILIELKLEYNDPDPVAMLDCAIGVLDCAPAVDAVEVIRCVHCEHYFKHPLKFDNDEGHCVINGKIKTDDDYCSRGKKFGGV